MKAISKGAVRELHTFEREHHAIGQGMAALKSSAKRSSAAFRMPA